MRSLIANEKGLSILRFKRAHYDNRILQIAITFIQVEFMRFNDIKVISCNLTKPKKKEKLSVINTCCQHKLKIERRNVKRKRGKETNFFRFNTSYG